MHTLLQPDHAVLHVRDAAGHDASDRKLSELIASAGSPLVISVDLDISDNPHRIMALREWQCPVYLLASAWLELKPWDQTWMLMRILPVLISKSATSPGSSIHLVAPGMKTRIRKIA
jgi:hypothetical protein